MSATGFTPVPQAQAQRRARIIVVDDQPANLKLMGDLLEREGYSVRLFPRGRLALAAALKEPPDLFLTDITMPEMNGFDVCRQLKADPNLADIPVIFLSGLDATQDKVTGLRCGGVDYITKPFQLDEVRARVKTHLEVHRLHSELKRHTDHLEDLVKARTRELTEAQARLQFLDKAKTDFLKLISHELNTPLNGILGIGELAFEMLPPGSEAEELRDLFEQSRQRILGITGNALLLTQIEVEAERFQPKELSLRSLLEKAQDRAVPFGENRQVTLRCSAASSALVVGNEELLVKALQSLMETGVKFSTSGQSVEVSCGDAERMAYVVIESQAGHIPPAAMDRFFDIFSIGEAVSPGGELGLDPPIADRILKLFGGSATVENREPAGIRITASFVRAE